MLVPRHTKMERAGIVVSVFSVLAIAAGTLAVSPDTTSSGVTDEKPQVVFDQAPGELERKCVKETTAKQAKSPQGVGQGDWFSGPTPEELCDMGANGISALPRPLTLREYAHAYAANIASAVANRGATYDTISGSRWSEAEVRTVASPYWIGLANLLLYWGVRFLLIGLFLIYLFEATLGRLIRFVWQGSARA